MGGHLEVDAPRDRRDIRRGGGLRFRRHAQTGARYLRAHHRAAWRRDRPGRLRVRGRPGDELRHRPRAGHDRGALRDNRSSANGDRGGLGSVNEATRTALREELGAAPPYFLADLPDPELEDLVKALSAARIRQAEELEDAIDKAMRFIPWGFRGAVKKVLLG